MLDKLEKVYYYAINNNEFYKETYKHYNLTHEDFNVLYYKLPIISKAMLQRYKEGILSIPYNFYPDSKRLIISRSSGSTGEYMKVFWDKNDKIRSMFSTWVWRKKFFNVTPYDKYISFHAVKHMKNRFVENVEPIEILSKNHTALSKINLTEERINQYFEYINEYQPVWIHTQPSIISLLYEYIDSGNNRFPQSLKYIETTGEPLNAKLKGKFSEKLNLTITNNYGCTETSYISLECPCGNMHIIDDNVHVDIVDNENKVINNGTYGKVIVSSKNNFAMPLLRFDTGDIGRIKRNHQCPCGMRSDVIELLGVRNSNMVVTSEGRTSAYVFLYAVEKTNEQFNNAIIQYKVEQKETNVLHVYFVLDSSFAGWEESIRKGFIANIPDDYLRECKWKIEYVEHIFPSSRTGKLQFFESFSD